MLVVVSVTVAIVHHHCGEYSSSCGRGGFLFLDSSTLPVRLCFRSRHGRRRRHPSTARSAFLGGSSALFAGSLAGLLFPRGAALLHSHVKRSVIFEPTSTLHAGFKPVMDLRPFLTEELQEKGGNMLCRLFAVVVHVGKNSHSGHYLA